MTLNAVLGKYAAMGVMLLTAVPAGGIPTATALFGASLARATTGHRPLAAPAPQEPVLWVAWLILIVVLVGVLLTNVVPVVAFLWLLRRIWRMPSDGKWFELGRTAWLVMSALCFALGTACGVAFGFATDAL
jgi:hypothetical protein